MSTIFSERLFARFEREFGPHLQAEGISPEIFRNPAAEIPIDKYNRLLERVARNGNPAIGLKMGETIEPADLGVLGHALFAARDVLHLLETLSRYIYVYAQDNAVQLGVGRLSLVVEYKMTDPAVQQHRQDVEFAIAAINQVLRGATGTDLRPKFAEFEHPTPRHQRRHADVLRCPVRFGCSGNRLHYRRDVLRVPVQTADSRLFEALEFYLADRLKLRAQDGDLLARVKHLISASLHTGAPELEQLAELLGMSGRTLQRRLSEQGLVFGELVDQVRRDAALTYVGETDYRLSDIALMLGYNELSSFSRAFRRWTGVTPRAMRA